MGKGINTTCDECQTAVVAFHPTQDPISSADGSTHAMGCGSKGGCCTQAVAFTESKRAQSTTDDETWVPGEVSPTMSCFDQGDTRATTVVAFTQNSRDEVREINGDGQIAASISAEGGMHQTNYVAYDVHGTLATKGASQTDCLPASGHSDGSHQGVGVATAMAVRRLTPRECERLQGFPDDYTLVEYRKKPAADGPRYRALGNSMAVPVMRWIGERIAMANGMENEVQ